MNTFVLVPGFWLGGWAWDGVAGPLRAAGHRVHALTLTGLAERAHLATPETGLDTHIDDITRLILDEDLHEVILVAHSGAGAPVTGAADRLPERIARVVYRESGPQADGTRQLDNHAPEEQEAIRRRIADRGDGQWYPMPSFEELEASGASTEGLGEFEREMMRARSTPQPAGSVTGRLRLTGNGDKLPKTLITCSFPLDQVRAMIASGHPFFATLSGPEWEFAELPTGHWPMFSRPEETASLLSAV
jgi:pimeloyl-ACP methyl ester carboxylesterase